jgi:predicted amidohydrolase
MSWTIGIVQMDCVLGDVAANLARIEAHAGEATRRGADLVMFPECATTGYFLGDRIAALAEPIPGPSSVRLAALARATSAHLVVGLIEAADGVYYDDAVLFAPDGACTVYRKTHLFGPERAVFAAGERTVVAETQLGRLGLTVCYDLMFPEFVRALVLDGATMILNVTDWISDDWQRGMGWGRDSVVALARTRALENGVHVAMADRVGIEGGWTSLGGSTVASPTGQALVALGAEEDIAVAKVETGSVDLARWSEVATYLADRRPELYGRP